MTKKALLAVSFGTSYEDTRRRTIDATEQALAEAFPDRKIYRAWTSRFILRKLARTQDLHFDDPKAALDRMEADGITDVLIQPTHFTAGIEYDSLAEEFRAASGRFASLRMGTPLLGSEEDVQAVMDIIREVFPQVGKNDALLLMGHGAAHPSAAVYGRIDAAFAASGTPNIYMATVEGTPAFSDVLPRLKVQKPSRVYLAPFMFVAGDHANNDLAGEEPDSWKSLLEAEGFETEAVLKGFGEYPQIRELYIAHARKALE